MSIIEAHLEALYRDYASEYALAAPDAVLGYDKFADIFAPCLDDMETVTVEDGESFLYYSVDDEDGTQVCAVPVYGYHYTSEKALSRLFEAMSAQVTRGGTTVFNIFLYAHDDRAQRLFSMLQFGFMAEKGIYKIVGTEHRADGTYNIRTLGKDEIAASWARIWELTHEIIRHLQQPPVFYPCAEFTEDAYREFYLDGGTSLHAAFAPDGQMVGIIESNREPDMLTGAPSANAGEAYVIPSLRGGGLARELLIYAAEHEKRRGAEYLWVEHGTANPAARGFWNKYFSTYQYELVRTIRC